MLLQLRRYKRQKQLICTDEDIIDDHEVDGDVTCCDESLHSSVLSSWSRTAHTIEKSLADQLTIVYLDYVRDVE